MPHFHFEKLDPPAGPRDLRIGVVEAPDMEAACGWFNRRSDMVGSWTVREIDANHAADLNARIVPAPRVH